MSTSASKAPSKPPFSRHEEQKIIEEFNSREIPSKIDEYKAVFVDMMDRPWFSRTWVIQESSVNLQVIFGSLNFGLDRLMEWIGVIGIDQKPTSFVGLVAVHPALFTLRLIDKLRRNWLTRDISTVLLSKINNIIGLVDALDEYARRIVTQHLSSRNELLDQ